ncbi:MAG TPA: hypothetical protein VL522_10225 [Bordetella sp.]|nr:hypothetical protein [Bordetella sp.]
MFANMYLAYDTLSETMKGIIDDLWAVHDLTLAHHNRGRKDIDEARRDCRPWRAPWCGAIQRLAAAPLYVGKVTTAGIMACAMRKPSHAYIAKGQ